MNKGILIIFTTCLIFSIHIRPDFSQTLKKLTLQEVLELAQDQSPDAILAKHRFRGNYWQYRTFKAKYRPSLNLSATLPEYSRVFEKEFDFETQQEYYVEKNTNNSQLQLSLSQNVGLTGGRIFMRSDLRRFDIFGGDGSTQYITTPVSIGFSQPINGYNSLRWEKEIEPIRYEEAKKNYIDAVEVVNIKGVGLFFDLALDQLNEEISEINYSNADTLFLIAQGRYNIGTIAENELLQMELALLNAGTAVNQAGINLQASEFNLRSFLGFNENVKLELIIPAQIPELEIELNKAIEQARENNPELLNLERQLLQAAQNVAEARSQKGLNANLFASYGLTQRAEDISGAYKNPMSQQRVSVGIELPIVDWGLGKGQYKMAQSQEEVIRTQVRQSQIDFEQNIFLNVNQFNLQDDQLLIAAKADNIAQRRYDVTKQRFLIGKIDVLDLNVADSEKDVAKRGYIAALRNYWTAFYYVRRLTLFDFERNQSLEADFEKLVE